MFPLWRLAVSQTCMQGNVDQTTTHNTHMLTTLHPLQHIMHLAARPGRQEVWTNTHKQTQTTRLLASTHRIDTLTKLPLLRNSGTASNPLYEQFTSKIPWSLNGAVVLQEQFPQGISPKECTPSSRDITQSSSTKAFRLAVDGNRDIVLDQR